MANLTENIQEARKNINDVWDVLVAHSVPDEALEKLNNALHCLAEAENEIGVFFSGQI